MTSTESTRELIADAFKRWEGGDFRGFSQLFAEDLQWTVIGSTGISGRFDSRDAFLDGAANKLMAALAEPLVPSLVGIIADGNEVALRFTANALARNAEQYNQVYCWVMKVQDGLIREGTAYLDTALVDRVLA